MSMIPPVSALLDFRGRTVLVTGSGAGLGSAIAARFAEAGARVVVHYGTSQAAALATVQRIEAAGGEALALQADVTDADAITVLVASTVAHFGAPDVLVNNAGIYPLHSLLEMSASDWDNVLNANLRSAFLCTQAVARALIAPNAAARSSTSHPSRQKTRRWRTATTTLPRPGWPC